MSFFNSIGRSIGNRRPRKSPTSERFPQHLQFPAGNSGYGNSGHPNPQSFGQLTKPPLFMCSPFVRTHLVKGSFKTIVVLPKYVDLNEWLASNVFEFFNYLNQFYGTVTEFCTAQRCPIMNGGPGHDYTWMDNQRKQVKLPAPTYIDYTMTWMNNLISDETVFPTKAGRDFPPNFIYTVRHLVRQMMRIFCHVYYHHFEQIVHLCLEGHYNSLFAHFISFAKEFDLLEQKDVEPLMGLIEILEQNGNIS